MAEWNSGDLRIRSMKHKAGGVVPAHLHPFPHTSLVCSGKWLIRVKDTQGVVREVVLPNDDHRHCLIRAGAEHEMTCLEDGEIWCVFNHRTPDGVVCSERTGWEGAYV